MVMLPTYSGFASVTMARWILARSRHLIADNSCPDRSRIFL